MNARLVLAAVIAGALAFAGYQAYLISKPVAAAPADPQPTPPTPAGETPSVAPPVPVVDASAESSEVGVDAPFDVATARRITALETKERIDKGVKITFVDTRTNIPDAIIRGAVQVPVEKLDGWSKGVSKSAFLVIYCTCPNEGTAANEVLALQKKGFRNAFALKDGLFGWQSYDLPTDQPPHAPE